MRTFLAALLTGLTLAYAPGAVAGPTPGQPATRSLSRHQAHVVATFAVRQFTTALPKPRGSRISHCVDGPKVWRCRVGLWTPGTQCSAVMWVWADHRDIFYYEWHHLTCS